MLDPLDSIPVPDPLDIDPVCTKMAAHAPHLGCPGITKEEIGEFDTSAWWLRTNTDDFNAFVPKFDEYGSEDLLKIGENLADIIGREVTPTQATELGIYFYLQGKMARWAEAVKEGRLVSDDTLHDLTIYSMMARLNRAGGMN